MYSTLINKSDILNIPDSLQDRLTLSHRDMKQKCHVSFTVAFYICNPIYCHDERHIN